TFSVTRDLYLNLATRDTDQVTLDLNHQTTPGGVHIQVGAGDPGVSVFGGTIKGDLTVVRGPGRGLVSLCWQAPTVPRPRRTAPPAAAPRGRTAAWRGCRRPPSA